MTYQRRTKSFGTKSRKASREVSKKETTTSRTVHSNKTNHEYNTQNTRKCQTRQSQNRA